MLDKGVGKSSLLGVVVGSGVGGVGMLWIGVAGVLDVKDLVRSCC